MPMMIQPQHQNSSNKVYSKNLNKKSANNAENPNNNSTNNAQSEDRKDTKESNNRKNTATSNSDKKGENKLKDFLKSIPVLWDALKWMWKFIKFIIKKIKENNENKRKAKLKASHHRKNKHL